MTIDSDRKPFFLLLGVLGAATFAIAQSIEGYVLTPRIVGNRVGLNQLETLAAILIGGEAGGFPGMVLAIPAGGILKKSFGLFLMSSREDSGRTESGEEERSES